MYFGACVALSPLPPKLSPRLRLLPGPRPPGLSSRLLGENPEVSPDEVVNTIVKRDEAHLKKIGVSGTPALFINGRFLSGAQPLNEITKIIDDELQRKGVATASTSK